MFEIEKIKSRTFRFATSIILLSFFNTGCFVNSKIENLESKIATIVMAPKYLSVAESTPLELDLSIEKEGVTSCSDLIFEIKSSDEFKIESGILKVTGNLPACKSTLNIANSSVGEFEIEISGYSNKSLAAIKVFVFRIQVVPVNDAPVGVSDMVYIMAGTTYSIDVLANDNDLDGDTLTISSVSSSATKGSVTIESNKILYAASAGMNGLDFFTYTARDPSLATTAAITVTVKVMNPFTWTGNGGNTEWSNLANWCGSINASASGCTGQTSVPSGSSSVFFDGTCTTNCSPRLPANYVSLANLTMDQEYTGTIMADTTSAGSGIIVSGDFQFGGGTLEIGNSQFTKNLQVGGTLAYQGGTFVDKGCGESLMAEPNRCFVIGTIRVYSDTMLFCNRHTTAQSFYLQKHANIDTCSGNFYAFNVNLDVGTKLNTSTSATDSCFNYSSIANSGTILDNGNRCPPSGGSQGGGSGI